jgi:histidine ammonia-lyase
MKQVIIDHDMTLADVVAVARNGAGIQLSSAAGQRIRRARALVDRWVKEEKVIYGVTTGFGALSDVTISGKDTRRLQQNILMSHAAGVGQPLDAEIVRAAIAIRINDLARGHSGIRLETVEQLAAMLNAGICPVVPAKGSVGASGDLAPMAHMFLVAIGLGEAIFDSQRVSGAEALRRCGLKPLTLESGEGLALVNGTQVMAGTGCLCVLDAIQLSQMSDIAAAMSLEVLMGSRAEFDPRIHQIRPHPGQIAAADNMLRITANSEIITSHKDCKRVQDAYTLRCSPQVHGASRDIIDYAQKTMITEINSCTGNPLFFPDTEQFLLGGNFHGQPLAMALDSMAMAVAELANISERRIERLVNPQLSGLPAFLVSDGGLNSGFMIAQYTAASLVSENKVLSHPAVVDSIPTSANKEDHVSMGSISARKCREIIKNAQYVLAIELLCGAQAMDLFTNLKPGEGTLAAYQCVRDAIAPLVADRILSTDIEAMCTLMKSGKIIDKVEAVVGKLK